MLVSGCLFGYCIVIAVCLRVLFCNLCLFG